MRSQSLLRKVGGIQSDDKIGLACFCTGAKRLSFGSGEISLPAVSGTSSAWERIRLMTAPMRWGRTLRCAKISLYSSMISSLINQTKVSYSI